MLRQMLIKAQNYGKKKEFSRDLKLEMMKKVIDREIPLLITAHRSRDIMTAIRIAKEFNIKIVLDGVSDAHLFDKGDQGIRIPRNPSRNDDAGWR